MQGVGAGRLISNRYALAARRAARGDIEVWRATDNTLGREVSVTLFPTSHPQAEAVLDAARRSAAINDHRLIRVLDVGTRGDLAWLVEESLAESASIADLVAGGPLPPEEARRIAGEVAGGLDVAAERGLHHLHITPHSVRRTRGGLVKIAGLATAAAFEGGPEPSAAEAAKADTVGTVGVMYAAMTGRWPGDAPCPGLDPAPRVGRGVASPAELVADVPPDLDAVARVTLNHGDGPATPGELAERIAPWSSTRVDKVAPAARVAAGAGAKVPAGAAPAEAARPASFARVTDRRREHRTARAAATRARLEARRNDPGFLNLPEALERQRHDPLPAPAPLISSEPEVEGRYAKLVLGVVAVVIVLALAFAIPTIGKALSTPLRPAASSAAPTVPPATASKAATPKPTATPSLKPISVDTAHGYDPGGDGAENEDQAKRAIDGDADTAWTSEGYRDPINALDKKGVGLRLDLPDDSTVSRVDLDLGDVTQSVSVYAGDSQELDSDTLLGSVKNASGKTSIQAKTPVKGAKYVIVWITDAAQTDDRYRAKIAEATVY